MDVKTLNVEVDFFNNTDGNYSFIVQAVNATDKENSTENFWMVVDTSIPFLVYNSNTETASSGADRDWIFVNVTATDPNNVSSKLTFSLYNSSGLVNQTQLSYNIFNINNTINWTGLVNAAYTFNVTANDSATNENSTTSRTFYLDGGAPTATAACSDIYKGYALSCTCSGTDSISTVTTSQSSTGSLTDTSTPGTFTYTCTATDLIGNSASNTAAYTIFNTGGGGGGNPPPPKKIHLPFFIRICK